MKKYLFIAITSLLFISRFFLFISTQDVGIEHDSGWYLGVARNVAERGIYASYTNTIASSDKQEAYPSIHGRYSVQDTKGFVYFPAGVTVGPGYVLPEALFLKLFGYGWMQFRLWPFIAFCILIPILFILILQMGSILGLIFFQIWLWCYPQIFLSLSFESFSEHIALLFLLLGFIAFQKWVRTPKKIVFIILAGLSFGVSFQTKNIFLIGFLFSIASIVFIAMKKKSALPLLVFLFSLALPTMVFELYRFVCLYSQFGIAGYTAANIDIMRTWQSGGSGVSSLLGGLHLGFIYRKLSVWSHIGVSPFLFAWPCILISPFIHTKKTYLYWTMLLSSLLFFVWFGLLSSTGWFRHILPGVVLGMIMVSITINDIYQKIAKKRAYMPRFIFYLGIPLIIAFLAYNTLALPQFAITQKQIIALYKAPFPNNFPGPQFVPLFSQKREDEATSFITKSIPPNTKICFYEWALVAELPPLVDRPFFPLPRCTENDVVIIGPYQKGVYTINNTHYDLLIKKICKRVLFENAMYTMCQIKKG